MKIKLLPMLLAVALAPLPSFADNELPAPEQAAGARDWAAWGGTVAFRMKERNLRGMGITIQRRVDKLAANTKRLSDGLGVRQALGSELFAIRDTGSLQFRAERGSFSAFVGGSLQTRGGYVLELEDGSTIDLINIRLRPNPADPLRLDVVSGNGDVWFYIVKPMYELLADNSILAIYTADMHASEALAMRTGHPEMNGAAISDVEVLTEVTERGSGGARDWFGIPSPTHYHGDQVAGQAPGVVYQTDLFMQNITVANMNQQGTSGPNGTGRVVFAPSSTLRNNVNAGTAQVTIPSQGALGTSTALWTAWVPWHSKFSGNFAPYGNDQHPFLIWNMYRINADGSIEQIGRSGVKHAWLTTNLGCASGENFDNHVLGRSCSDTYSSFNNDANQDLSFRSEIIPATGQWGRCRSLFDPNCVGSNTNSSPSDDGFVRRMVVTEPQISSTVNPGASYIFDSFYLARQDINIYNSMATVTGTPTYSGGNWVFAGTSNFKLGSVTDRWVENLPAGTLARNQELAVSEGHSKLAVRVTDLGNGQWRYHYALHNIDFSRPVTSGSEPNLEVIRNLGFDRFQVPLPAGVNVISSRFSDGDTVAANDWTFSSAGGQLTWTAPSGTALDWGTLYLFSVVVDGIPVDGNASMRVAEAGLPSSFTLPTLVPQSDVIFAHDFD